MPKIKKLTQTTDTLEQCFDELDFNNLEIAKNEIPRAASFVNN